MSFIILTTNYINKSCFYVISYSSRIRTLSCNHWTYLRITRSRLRAFLRYIQLCQCTNVVLVQYYTTDYANWLACHCKDWQECCNFYFYVLCVFVSVSKYQSCYRFSVFISLWCCVVNYATLSSCAIYIVCTVCRCFAYISHNCEWKTYSCTLLCTFATYLYCSSCSCYSCFCFWCRDVNSTCTSYCWQSNCDVIKVVSSFCLCRVMLPFCSCYNSYFFFCAWLQLLWILSLLHYYHYCFYFWNFTCAQCKSHL